MDKRFIVVVGNDGEASRGIMISYFLLSKLWEEDPNQRRGVKSFTTAYQLIPKSMGPAKGYWKWVAKHICQISLAGNVLICHVFPSLHLQTWFFVSATVADLATLHVGWSV
jgi:hypothetical protein